MRLLEIKEELKTLKEFSVHDVKQCSRCKENGCITVFGKRLCEKCWEKYCMEGEKYAVGFQD